MSFLRYHPSFNKVYILKKFYSCVCIWMFCPCVWVFAFVLAEARISCRRLGLEDRHFQDVRLVIEVLTSELKSLWLSSKHSTAELCNNQTKLGVEQVPEIHPSLSLKCWDYKSMPPYPFLFCLFLYMFWGFNTTLMLTARQGLTDWATSWIHSKYFLIYNWDNWLPTM